MAAIGSVDSVVSAKSFKEAQSRMAKSSFGKMDFYFSGTHVSGQMFFYIPPSTMGEKRRNNAILFGRQVDANNKPVWGIRNEDHETLEDLICIGEGKFEQKLKRNEKAITKFQTGTKEHNNATATLKRLRAVPKMDVNTFINFVKRAKKRVATAFKFQ